LQKVTWRSYQLWALDYSLALRLVLSFLSASTSLSLQNPPPLSIDRGVESAIAGDPEPEAYSYKIASRILLGFAFMFLVDEYMSAHARPLASQEAHGDVEEVHFDIALSELEREEGMILPGSQASTWQMLQHPRFSTSQRAYPLSLGLVVHALVDGYALGVSSLDTRSGAVSFVVFLAIIIHKGMPIGRC
jgi:solute carrier family 39 (zinc transporter), member 9